MAEKGMIKRRNVVAKQTAKQKQLKITIVPAQGKLARWDHKERMLAVRIHPSKRWMVGHLRYSKKVDNLPRGLACDFCWSMLRFLGNPCPFIARAEQVHEESSTKRKVVLAPRTCHIFIHLLAVEQPNSSPGF